jgi:hypothetical protein
VLRQKLKNQNCENSSGDGGMFVHIIYTTQFLTDLWRLSGFAKSGEQNLQLFKWNRDRNFELN